MLRKKMHVIYGILLIPFCVAVGLVRFYNPDTAAASFVGRDFAAGNFLLNDWILSTQSYFTTDYLWHGIIALFTGNMPVAAIAGSVGIICFSWMVVFLLFRRVAALHGADSSAAHPYATDILFAVFLVSIVALKSTVFNSPTHSGTVAFSMLGLFFFYGPRRTLWSCAAFVVCAAMAMAGDSYAFVYLALPLVGEVCFRYFRHRQFDLAVFLLPVAIAVAVLWAVFCRAYGYELPGMELRFVEFAEFPRNIYWYFAGLFHEFSAWFWGRPVASAGTLVALFFAAILLLLVFSQYAARHFSSRAACFLVFSSITVSLAFLFSNAPVALHSGRYLLGIFYNGIVLAALFLVSKAPVRLCLPLRLAMICGVLVVSVAILAIAPVKEQTNDVRELGAVLQQKGLWHGYGEFASTYNVALYGGGKVSIAPIVPHGDGYSPYYWMTKTTWYTDMPATFIILDTTQPQSESGLSAERILAVFGPPHERFCRGRYEIFSYGYNLATRLHAVRQ